MQHFRFFYVLKLGKNESTDTEILITQLKSIHEMIFLQMLRAIQNSKQNHSLTSLSACQKFTTLKHILHLHTDLKQHNTSVKILDVFTM